MRSIVLALCVLSSTAAFAQTRYRLERILVEGSVIAEEIIRAEARLEEEKSYTEEDFRQAVYRVRRLPFVTEATYRVVSGMAADTVALVIRIVDTSIAYYDVDARGDDSARDASALAGARMLLDDLGVVEAAVQSSDNDDGVAAGVAYRAYDLFGRGAFASIAVAHRFQSRERRYDPTPVLTFGWPLSQRQSLTLTASRAKSRIAREHSDTITLTDRDSTIFAELRWSYESIDHPLFATRGLSIGFGPRWSRTDYATETYDDEIVTTKSTAKHYDVALTASAYRPLFGKSVGFVRIDADASRDVFNRTALAGLAYDFRPYRARFEIGAGSRNEELFGEAALVVRHRWGTVRLTALFSSPSPVAAATR